MSHRELLRQIRRRPGMYFGHGGIDFDWLIAFLVGLDLGTDGRLLDGFREYLILRLGEESSLWWPGLAIRTYDPTGGARPTTPEDDQVAVNVIFDLLDEFLAEFPEQRSRKRLHHEYVLWKQQLSFFDLDLERFRSSPRPDAMSVDEAAEALGLTRAALFDLVAAGQLEVFRVGADLFVRRNKVNELRNREDAS